jgi:hypothetical protein
LGDLEECFNCMIKRTACLWLGVNVVEAGQESLTCLTIVPYAFL